MSKRGRKFGNQDFSVGDLVRVLGHNVPEMAGKIIAIKRRYGRVNNGCTYQSPVLTIDPIDGGESKHLDASFVIEIIERAPYRPVNIFRDYWLSSQVSTGYDPEKIGNGVVQGDLFVLAEYELASLPIPVLREVNRDRLRELYFKNPLGLVKRHRACQVEVKIDRFRQWIRKNALRILCTVRELEKQETDANNKFAKAYYDSLDCQFERELQEV